ncbi:MAG: exodeoxyribonuclease V subunit gamma, partial [Lachnospiraceae bacterium]|nr:exodeoxyribonuclease V subunit gamma [Lachnospiraceae bacterium]
EEYRFRDIAVITGDMDSYYIPVRDVFEEAKISCFIDYKSPVTDNQLIRFLMGAVDLVENRLSYDAVFTYLKTYLTDLDKDEIALLENYCLEFGIKGIRQFSEPFTKNSNWDLDEVNAIREKFFDEIRDFYFRAIEKDRTGKDFSNLLIDLCKKNRIREKMDAVRDRLNAEGSMTLAKEYEQIYKRAEELLDKIALLMGGETIAIRDYREVLESALKEIRIGIIPPSLDAVTFGDLTRTRLDKTKAIFLIGVNDGKIPAVASKTGLLSQKERELLRQDFEIAPTIEEDLYTQRFYLYLMLNKPQEVLYLTYAGFTATGEEIRPSYLLEEIGELVPSASPEIIFTSPQISWEQESLHDLAGQLRSFAEKEETDLPEEEKDLLQYFAQADPDAVRQVIEGAFYSNKQTPLDPQVALDLYGEVLKGSVSRFENFNECAYKHFLNYGLRIDERPEYRIDATDLGSLYHDALDLYSKQLNEEGFRFSDVSDTDSERIANESVDKALQNMEKDVLQSTKRLEFLTDRVRQVTLKTTDVLREQVRAGLFEPEKFEFFFEEDADENTRFLGKIDRVDIYDADDVFVKIIDYKSGKKEFKAKDIYSGLQLQLVAYMKAAIEQVKKEHPDKNVKPGGVYYYLIQDNYLAEDKQDNKFQMSGLTSCEEGVIEAVDQSLSKSGKNTSSIIPVKMIANNDEFWHLLEFVDRKIKDVSEQIRNGNVDIAPYPPIDSHDVCKYCKYKDICRFEAGRFGTDWNNMEQPSNDDLNRELYGRI